MFKQLLSVRGLLTIVITLNGLYSASLFAGNVSANVSSVLGQPIKQSLKFEQDVRLLKKGDTVTLPLTEEEITTFTVNSNETTAEGGKAINATSTNGTNLLLSADQNATYGSITGNGMKYAVDFDSTMGTVLINQNHAQFPIIDLGNDGIVPPGMSPDLPGIEQMTPEQKSTLEAMQLSAKQQLSTAQATADVSNIRMLILYSNEFANGFASPSARINQLLQFTNQSIQSSGIDLVFTLARAQVLNFNNNLTTNTILNQVQAGEGAFASVASLRDQVAADMVAVLSFQSGFSANGVAFINGSNPNSAFSSTRLSPGCCDSVFAHELGHNMGSGHDRESVMPNSSGACDFNFTGYSCGHGNSAAGWGTIMARNPLDSRIVNNVFSNPSLDCLGLPCGVPEGQTNSADNFRSFNISRLLVANFRPDPVAPPVNPGPPSAPSGIILAPAVNLLLDDDN